MRDERVYHKYIKKSGQLKIVVKEIKVAELVVKPDSLELRDDYAKHWATIVQ